MRRGRWSSSGGRRKTVARKGEEEAAEKEEELEFAEKRELEAVETGEKFAEMKAKKESEEVEKEEMAEVEEHEMAENEEEYGVRKPMRKLDPREPSKQEKEEHDKTHVPYRNWCRHCVRGRGKEEDCRKANRVPEKPEVHMDFMFMGEEKSEKTLVMLVAKERSTKAVMSCVTPKKSDGEWLAKRVMAFMREFGCEVEPVTMKTDNEPALVKVVEYIGRLRAAKGGTGMVVENSPVYSSKSNGYIERAVQSVQGMVRTLRSAVEEKWGVKLEIENAIWPWMTEYASLLLTRMEVSTDGKTAYERSRGKVAKMPGLEFGEGVLWKRRREGGPLGKLTCMWEDGIFLGIKGSTGEMIVGDEKGVWRTRTIRRKPVGDRWDRENLKYVGGVPWSDGEGGHGDPKTEVVIMDKEYRERVQTENHEPVPRKVYITKGDFEEHGYTARCPGCISILRGTTRQAHSVECRKRMESELKGTEKARKAEKRMNDYADKKLAEEEEKKRKKEAEDESHKRDEEKSMDVEAEKPTDMEAEKEPENTHERDEKAKRKRQEEEDEEEAMMKTTTKWLRKMEREDRKKKREARDEQDADMDEVEVFDEDRRDQPDGKAPGKKVHGFEVNEEAIDFEGNEEVFEVEIDDNNQHLDVQDLSGQEGEWTEMDPQEEIDKKLAEEGVKDEVDYMVKKLNMFEFGTLEEAWERGGKAPTTTKWVKGWKFDDDGKKFMRCRLVARDFKVKNERNRDDLFAAMPPLEAKKMLFRMTAGVRGWRRRNNKEEVKLMFIDVKKAHLNARCDEEEWVELPEEFWEWGRYAKLKRWLYGMRKAASGWEEDFAENFKKEGFRRGRGAPTVFFNKDSGVRVVVHGDDFTVSGVKKGLEHLRDKMAEWYEIKDRGIMGSGRGEIREVKILGRTVRWTDEGIEYEADEKHRKELMKRTGLMEDSKAVVGPAVKDGKDDGGEHDEELTKNEKSEFRGCCALLNYLGLDRSDIQFATNQLCREMAKPTRKSMMKMKRIVRYLVGAERLVWRFNEWNGDRDYARLDVYVDSDWAGGEDRKSTSGGIVLLEGVAVKHWSRTQRSRALSVGEAEYYALVTGSAEGLGIESLADDMGYKLKVTVVWTDSNTARSLASRRGLGKMRHVELRYLWVQDMVKENRLRVKRVSGVDNPADHLTKPKGGLEMEPAIAAAGGALLRRGGPG